MKEIFAYEMCELCELPYFCSGNNIYVVKYGSKNKNTTQDSFVELAGSPIAPIRCKQQDFQLLITQNCRAEISVA